MIDEIMKWKTITPNRVEKILEYHKNIFGDEMVSWYKNCKCPGALRTMLSDLKLHMVRSLNQ
jgi:hypothetical protein